MYVLPAIPIPRQLEEKIAPMRQTEVFHKLLRPSRMELHITLKAPQIISNAQKDAWVDAAQATCEQFSSVELEITSLGFLTSTVLALYIESKSLMELHDALAKALEQYNSPARGLHEGKQYQPHLRSGGPSAGR